MTTEAITIAPPGVQWQERRLGRTILRTYRTTIELDDVLPNPNQPRLGPKEDPELQRQIEANEGIFEPLLLEPHPEHPGKFRIIDGDRRWTNSKVLVEVHKKEQYRRFPAEVTDRTLTEDERLRVWIYIHRQRKEWDAKEKEMVAYRLVDLVGRASAANILGITVREEIKNLNRKLLTPSVLNTLIRKVNDQQITNSKDVRKLRQVLRDPVARDEFLSEGASIESALLKLSPAPTKKRQGLTGDIQALADTIKGYPWTTLDGLKGDPDLIRTLEETEKLLKDLRRTLGRS